jgi:hypothetical protein
MYNVRAFSERKLLKQQCLTLYIVLYVITRVQLLTMVLYIKYKYKNTNVTPYECEESRWGTIYTHFVLRI